MRDWFRNLRRFFQEQILPNWQYKLASLVAALIIWAYVAGLQSMQVVFTVPIRFQNIPPGTQIVGQKVTSAEVTLAGRRDQILMLKQKEVWVSLDLSGLGTGRNLYLISSRDVVVPAGIEIKDVSPRQLTIRLVLE